MKSIRMYGGGEGGAIQSGLRGMFYTNVVGSSGLSVQNKACSH